MLQPKHLPNPIRPHPILTFYQHATSLLSPSRRDTHGIPTSRRRVSPRSRVSSQDCDSLTRSQLRVVRRRDNYSIATRFCACHDATWSPRLADRRVGPPCVRRRRRCGMEGWRDANLIRKSNRMHTYGLLFVNPLRFADAHFWPCLLCTWRAVAFLFHQMFRQGDV